MPAAVSNGVILTPTSSRIMSAAAPTTKTLTAFLTRLPTVCSRLAKSRRSQLSPPRLRTTVSKWSIPSAAIRMAKYASAPMSRMRKPSSSSHAVARSSESPYPSSTPSICRMGRVTIASTEAKTTARVTRMGRRVIVSRNPVPSVSPLAVMKPRRTTRAASCATTSATTNERPRPTARSYQFIWANITVLSTATNVDRRRGPCRPAAPVRTH